VLQHTIKPYFSSGAPAPQWGKGELMNGSYFPSLAGLVAAGAIAGLSVPAPAATISIGTALNGGAITLRASGATPGPASFSGPVGGYNINVVDGTDLTAASLNSNAQDATTAGTSDVLDIFVSVSGITGLSGLKTALTGLTVNFLTAGWTVTESTFEDNTNTVFGMANSLTTHTFTLGPDTFSGFASVTVTTPFSVTELYEISSNGLRGAANDTIDLSAVVPEPSTWAMLGIGFAGLGFVGYRKARARSTNPDRLIAAII
jgi:PEP-CTERM motif